MLVLVRPCYLDFLKDELFTPHDSTVSQWLNYMVQVRAILADQGIEMHTWDMRPLEEADVILSQDLSLNRSELADAKRKAPRAKFVLQTLETPLDRLHHQDPRNHDLFDAVLTYNMRQSDDRRYFGYRLPVSPPTRTPAMLSFSERRPLVMVNTNRLTRLLGNRQSGAAGLPGIGPMFCGWRVPLSSLPRQSMGQLYSRRRAVARLAERLYPDVLDVYGFGWQGERIGWIHKFIRHRPYANARGRAMGWKYDYLCKYRFSLSFENVKSNVGYISEKIFDPLFAGTVPIYLGDEQITDAVPADCFVDARKFKNDRQLLEFARDCGQPEWLKMQEAGRRFLDSSAFKEFLAPALAARMATVFRHVTGGAANVSTPKKTGTSPNPVCP